MAIWNWKFPALLGITLGEIFRTRPERPWGPSSLLYDGYWVSPGGQTAGAWRWPPTQFSSEVKEKSIAIPLFPLWAFVAFPKVTFTFTFTFTPACP
jgi:hypothetical protein